MNYLPCTIADEGFQSLQDGYCEKHCGVFEDTDENKLEYTKIFEGYVRPHCLNYAVELLQFSLLCSEYLLRDHSDIQIPITRPSDTLCRPHHSPRPRHTGQDDRELRDGVHHGSNA